MHEDSVPYLSKRSLLNRLYTGGLREGVSPMNFPMYIDQQIYCYYVSAYLIS